MNKQLIITNKYKSDLKRVSTWESFNQEKCDAVIRKLRSGEPLDKRCRPHPMSNKKLYRGAYNLHLGPDLMLFYKMDKENLHLMRIGSHSQLLGNEKGNRK